MKYPIAIEPGDEKHAFGVVVPDLPGCFSAGDTLDEAFANAEEAVLLHLEALIENKDPIPKHLPIDAHQSNPDYAGWVWGVVSLDLSQLSDKLKNVNITMPENLLRHIDDYAKSHHETLSGFLARAAVHVMAE